MKEKLPFEKKRKMLLKSYITKSEYDEILSSSRMACLSISEFVRRACLGKRIKSREDSMARLDLFKSIGELKRLEGLLNQALSSGYKDKIYRMLHTIDKFFVELKEKIDAI